jgi:dsRNA-specific ribonuclease
MINEGPVKVNGVPKAEGTGTSVKIAKEIAAKEAYYSMGWAPSTSC